MNLLKKQFPDMVVVSWCGGASATKLTNWSVMKDRDIVIWPDNDKAGQKAAISIQEECQKNGARIRNCKFESHSERCASSRKVGSS